jgi:hypothetical protein
MPVTGKALTEDVSGVTREDVVGIPDDHEVAGGIDGDVGIRGVAGRSVDLKLRSERGAGAREALARNVAADGNEATRPGDDEVAKGIRRDLR